MVLLELEAGAREHGNCSVSHKAILVPDLKQIYLPWLTAFTQAAPTDSTALE